LRNQISLAGLVDEFGNLEHGAMKGFDALRGVEVEGHATMHATFAEMSLVHVDRQLVPFQKLIEAAQILAKPVRMDGEVFGSDATRLGRNPWEVAENTQKLLKNALSYAKKLRIHTGVGFEPYQIPDEIYRALPPEARFEDHNARPRFDPSSYTGRKLLEARLDNLLNSYPDVDHVWLWEDEGANWDSRKEGIPLPATAFQLTYDYLRRHAPGKRLIISGWGGVARHFADLHKVLPEDIVFSCLSDSLGWDPVHEVFGQLGSQLVIGDVRKTHDSKSADSQHIVQHAGSVAHGLQGLRKNHDVELPVGEGG